jgi:hypothetical protein
MDDRGKFLLYTANDGAVKIEVFFKEETVWLTQKALAELFGVQVPAVNKHLKNIFESGELVDNSVISILETTAADGKNYSTRYYGVYRKRQDAEYISDFDREIKRIEGKK